MQQTLILADDHILLRDALANLMNSLTTSEWKPQPLTVLT